MIIRFACKCGKPMQAKKEFAGRKMRCPSCGTVLTIPPDNGGTLDPAAAVTRISKSTPEMEATPIPMPSKPAKPTPPLKKKEEEVVAKKPEAPTLFPKETEEKEAIAVAAPPRAIKKSRESKKHAPANAWADHSLEQQITPWPVGDNDRVGDISRRQLSGRGSLLMLLVLFLLAGVAVAAFVLKDQLPQLFQANALEFSFTKVIS